MSSRTKVLESDIAASDQAQARGFLVRADYEGREVVMPGRPIVFGQISWRAGRS